eukprot:9485379-Pyramimonas_sp.AAC.3
MDTEAALLGGVIGACGEGQAQGSVRNTYMLNTQSNAGWIRQPTGAESTEEGRPQIQIEYANLPSNMLLHLPQVQADSCHGAGFFFTSQGYPARDNKRLKTTFAHTSFREHQQLQVVVQSEICIQYISKACPNSRDAVTVA